MSIKIVFIALICLMFSYQVQAVCCSASYFDMCADGTAGTPCCAYGGCNIFCCNCDGGCRSANN